MADFTSAHDRVTNIREAYRIIDLFKNVYLLSKNVNEILNRYQTDVDFRSQADHVYSPEQLAEIAEMIVSLQDLQLNWEANHLNVIS